MASAKWRPFCLGLNELTDHNNILHTSRQLHCRDVCTISLWSADYIFKPEHYTFWSNFEIDRNPVSGMGAWSLSSQPWPWSVAQYTLLDKQINLAAEHIQYTYGYECNFCQQF